MINKIGNTVMTTVNQYWSSMTGCESYQLLNPGICIRLIDQKRNNAMFDILLYKNRIMSLVCGSDQILPYVEKIVGKFPKLVGVSSKLLAAHLHEFGFVMEQNEKFNDHYLRANGRILQKGFYPPSTLMQPYHFIEENGMEAAFAGDHSDLKYLLAVEPYFRLQNISCYSGLSKVETGILIERKSKITDLVLCNDMQSENQLVNILLLRKMVESTLKIGRIPRIRVKDQNNLLKELIVTCGFEKMNTVNFLKFSFDH